MTNIFTTLDNITRKLDEKGNNIFNTIKQMVKDNIKAEKDNSMFNTEEYNDTIKVLGFYPQGAIKYLTSQGALKVADVTVEPDDKWGKAYVIKFKDFDLDSPFFKSLKRRSINVSGIMEYNDEVRADDNRYMSNGNIVGYDAYYCDETKYEKLSREDSCVFELFAQWLGYENYQDFVDNNKRTDSEIDLLYTKFREGALAEDWVMGEEDQTLDEIQTA